MPSYTKQEAIDILNNHLNTIETLYTSPCVNWSGKTKDTNELYSEVIAHELLRNIKLFDNIKQVSRNNTYYREDHKIIKIDLDSNREEEIFAKRIAYLNLDDLGNILDYQIPMKDTRNDKGLGKIDLVSFNKKTKSLYLIELKYEKNPETLLRAVLEGYTYYKIVDKTKLINDFCNNHKFILNQAFNSVDPNEINVIPTVLVTPNCNPYKELEEVEVGLRPNLKALILALDVKNYTTELLTREIIL